MYRLTINFNLIYYN